MLQKSWLFIQRCIWSWRSSQGYSGCTYLHCMQQFYCLALSLVPQRCSAARVVWLRTGQQFFSHAAMSGLWEEVGDLALCTTAQPLGTCQCWAVLFCSPGQGQLLPYCLLSLETLCASQFTLVFQLSLRASLNFTLKCFSASSSVFPRARESWRQEAQISAQLNKSLLNQ